MKLTGSNQRCWPSPRDRLTSSCVIYSSGWPLAVTSRPHAVPEERVNASRLSITAPQRILQRIFHELSKHSHTFPYFKETFYRHDFHFVQTVDSKLKHPLVVKMENKCLISHSMAQTLTKYFCCSLSCRDERVNALLACCLCISVHYILFICILQRELN